MIVCALLVSLLALAPSQQISSESTGSESKVESSDDLPVIELKDIALRQYKVRNFQANHLCDAVRNMVGRSFYVKERGKLAAPVENISWLADKVLIFDEIAYCDKVLKTCEDLDDQLEGGEKPGDQREVVSVEYHPRFLSLRAVHDVLEPFRRSGNKVPNVSSSEAGNLVVLHDRPEVVDEMLELLARVDVPERQLQITCRLVTANQNGSQDSGGLPSDLTEHLGKLLPGVSFQAAGYGMLQTSVRQPQPLSLRLVSDQVYELSFQPVAYDEATGALTVQQCTLITHLTGLPAPTVRNVFTTNTIFYAGQYNVVGASGGTPVFVVVRLQPVQSTPSTK